MIDPALAPFGTGDVVIFVPDLKLCELLTNPVTDPSLFCRHLDNTGIESPNGIFFVVFDLNADEP